MKKKTEREGNKKRCTIAKNYTTATRKGVRKNLRGRAKTTNMFTSGVKRVLFFEFHNKWMVGRFVFNFERFSSSSVGWNGRELMECYYYFGRKSSLTCNSSMVNSPSIWSICALTEGRVTGRLVDCQYCLSHHLRFSMFLFRYQVFVLLLFLLPHLLIPYPASKSSHPHLGIEQRIPLVCLGKQHGSAHNHLAYPRDVSPFGVSVLVFSGFFQFKRSSTCDCPISICSMWLMRSDTTAMNRDRKYRWEGNPGDMEATRGSG